MSLTQEQLEIQALAKDFASSEIAPYAAEWDENSHFEPQVFNKLAELGFFGFLTPEKYGGLGLDTLSYIVALEEIAKGCASIAVALSVHNSLPTNMLLQNATEEQKQRYLVPMAKGEMLAAFALSEPESGSDPGSLATQAVDAGDHWILNGTKSWVTSGNKAGVIVAMARTDSPDNRKGGKGIGAFIVTPDMPGFIVGKKEDKMGLRASPTVQLLFEDLKVPKENVLGDPSKGLAYALNGLDNGRLGIAAQSIGIAQIALEHSLAYANERRQFGKPIRDNQAIQFKLADMATKIAAARALLHEAARAKDSGQKVTQLASMAKVFASEAAMWITTQAVQIFGGYGYVKDYPVEKLFRDAKVTEIYEGTSEIQRIVIARELYS